MTRPKEPDPLAFWRGLIVGGCLSACIWIAGVGGIYMVFFTPLAGMR